MTTDAGALPIGEGAAADTRKLERAPGALPLPRSSKAVARMLVNGIEPLLQRMIVGATAYVAVVVLLRVSGKRTLAKWNAFDLIVTVAFGSILATALVSQTVSLLQIVLAFATLIVLQFLVTRTSAGSRRFERLVKSRPTLLLYRGELLAELMLEERVTKAEVLAALREAGIGDLRDAAAVVLETDGSFSVIASLKEGAENTLGDVERPS